VISRRTLLKSTSALIAGASFPNLFQSTTVKQDEPAAVEVPAYLSDYSDQFAKDPRAAALQWFKDAKFGLFLHYGLYSLLERGEWVQLNDKIHVAEYAKLKDQFTAEKFDADMTWPWNFLLLFARSRLAASSRTQQLGLGRFCQTEVQERRAVLCSWPRTRSAKVR